MKCSIRNRNLTTSTSTEIDKIGCCLLHHLGTLHHHIELVHMDILLQVLKAVRTDISLFLKQMVCAIG